MFTRNNYYMILSLALLLSFCSSETNQSKSMDKTVTNADAQKEDDLKELNNQIRREKFNHVLPQAMKKNNIDMYIGTGGAPEGVLAAAALKCIDGQMQCRLLFNDDLQKERAKKMGIKNLNKKYNINDLIKSNAIFVASGVTDGNLLKGVKKIKNKFIVSSLIITTEKKKIDFINSEFGI